MPTALPHLFIDYENLQPPAADFARLRALDCRIWLFHGPHQNRFEADVVAAWQPLGERLRFVQGAKSGKNALDFHIAFALGQAWQQDAAQGTPAHYLVVSKDTGFDALIEHLHGLGARAARTKSIADALAAATPGDAAPTHASAARRAAPPKATAKASGKSAARSSGKSAGPTQPEASEADAAAASPKPAAPSPRAEAAGSPKATRAARRAPASKPGPASAPAPASSSRSGRPAKTAAKAAGERTAAIPRDSLAEGDVEQVLAALHARPRSRPADREALLRHIVSVLKHKVSSEVGEAVIRQLTDLGHIGFTGQKVQYRLADAAHDARGR